MIKSRKFLVFGQSARNTENAEIRCVDSGCIGNEYRQVNQPETRRAQKFPCGCGDGNVRIAGQLVHIDIMKDDKSQPAVQHHDDKQRRVNGQRNCPLRIFDVSRCICNNAVSGISEKGNADASPETFGIRNRQRRCVGRIVKPQAGGKQCRQNQKF